uniref:Cyclin P3 n=1 Tax=Vaccinium corymbosum TaxID=69266 RepID=A0A3G6IUI1_VACCO|nr:cyclin P3 [Vaccinium corymbosum]
MGTLPLETKTVTFDIYLSLGLKESDKENPEIPRVLWLLSSLLERSVQKNDMLLKNSQIKDVLTIFHGSRAPSLGIQQYLERIFKYSCCSPSCFVLAHIYLERFIQQKKVHLTSLNVHRLVITSVMVAAKFIDDS